MEQVQLAKERKLEEEQRKRDVERARLLKERETIHIQRLQILEKEINLYVEGKKDLQRNLLNRRMEQISHRKETPEQQYERRNDLVSQCCTHAVKMVPIIIEYWDTKRPSKDNPYYLPIREIEDYNVKYSATHKWDEAELIQLNFNIVEISLEPRFWDIMSTIQNILRPQSCKEIEIQFQMVKDDWEQ